jgi:hypothetical protein
MNYFAVKGINEDSFGYDFVNYKWKGAIKDGAITYKMVELIGEDGIKAHQSAIHNKILFPEDVTSTGDIAASAGVQYKVMSPAMGTEKPKTKKMRDKGNKVIIGGNQ